VILFIYRSAFAIRTGWGSGVRRVWFPMCAGEFGLGDCDEKTGNGAEPVPSKGVKARTRQPAVRREVLNSLRTTREVFSNRARVNPQLGHRRKVHHRCTSWGSTSRLDVAAYFQKSPLGLPIPCESDPQTCVSALGPRPRLSAPTTLYSRVRRCQQPSAAPSRSPDSTSS